MPFARGSQKPALTNQTQSTVYRRRRAEHFENKLSVDYEKPSDILTSTAPALAEILKESRPLHQPPTKDNPGKTKGQMCALQRPEREKVRYVLCHYLCRVIYCRLSVTCGVLNCILVSCTLPRFFGSRYATSPYLSLNTSQHRESRPLHSSSGQSGGKRRYDAPRRSHISCN